jgi:hypothetical protein
MKVKVNIHLSQRAPNCVYNSRGYYLVGELATSQCAQIQKCTATAFRWTVDRSCAAAQEPSLYVGPLLDNWKGICILALFTPQINIVPNNQTLPVPLMAHTWSKRAIKVIPLLIGLGIMAGIETGMGGIASSASYYNQLS